MTDLNTPFVDVFGDKACLADYPSNYVDQLYRDHGSYADVVERMISEEYTPDFCPERMVDVRGELFVNANATSSYYIGNVEFDFEVWEDTSQTDHRPNDYTFDKVPGRFHWLRDNCKGDWLIHTTQHVQSWDLPFEVYVTFLDQADEAAFLATFPEVGA